jgi:iron uptake system component EfeO
LASRLALAGAVLLVVLGGIAFYYASTLTHKAPATGGATRVTITADSCDPNDLTVPAGNASFEIVNASDRAVEWEILDGVMVVEERENIAPGFNQPITTKLKPGNYIITCGLLSNPRGALHVTASAAADAEAAAKPKLTAFIGPLAEYKVYLTLGANALVKATAKLDTAIKDSDLQGARAAYANAQAAYGKIEPEAQRFADLHNAIDGMADYFADRENDPGFTGFHRIEYSLFTQNSIEGLAPVADKLVTDVTALQDRLKALKTAPEDLADNAERLLQAVADTKIADGEDRYAFTDLSTFAANAEAARKVADLLRAIAPAGSDTVLQGLDSSLAALDAELNKFKTNGTFVSYQTIGAADRKALAEKFTALAASIGQLNATLGLA